MGRGPCLLLFLLCCFPFTDTDHVDKLEDLENIEDKDMKAAFERWKSKSYALTVPLRIVALEGSLPPTWIRVRFISFNLRIWLKQDPDSENVFGFMLIA